MGTFKRCWGSAPPPRGQQGFCTSQERQKPLLWAPGGCASPKPPLCASVAIKTGKRMARSGGLFIWDTPSIGVGKAGLHSPKTGHVAAPISTTELGSRWPGHSIVPRDQGNGAAQPIVPPHPGDIGDQAGWDAAPSKKHGTCVWLAHPGARGCWLRPTVFFPLCRASSGAFYSCRWLSGTAKLRNPQRAVPGARITPGARWPPYLRRKVLVKFPLLRSQTVPGGGDQARAWLCRAHLPPLY